MAFDPNNPYAPRPNPQVQPPRSMGFASQVGGAAGAAYPGRGSSFMSGAQKGFGAVNKTYGAPPAPAAAPVATNPYGSESGNTYLEDRYLNRANGTDAAYNYAAKRGMEGLGTQYAAGGSFNSGAARQGESDFLANLTAQSQGQLDSLAAGATGARQNKLNSMFSQGTALAGGEAGTVSPYALGAAGAMSNADQAYLYMLLNKAGVEGKARQGGLNALVDIGKAGANIYGGKPA